MRTKISNECTAQEGFPRVKNIKEKMEKEATQDGEALILLNCELQVWTAELHSKQPGHLAKEAPEKMLKTKPAFSFLFIVE